MNSCPNPANPLRRDGTSRRTRLVAALAPEHAPIDERRIGDLLLYARDYARLLRYYTPGNAPGGDWVPFIEGDASMAVASIGRLDPATLRRDYQSRRKAALDPAAVDRKAALAALFEPVFDLARAFDGWLGAAVPGLALESDLLRLIGSALADALGSAWACALRARDLAIPVPLPDAAELDARWNLGTAAADGDFLPGGWPAGEAALAAAVRRLGTLHERFLEGLSLLVARASAYLEDSFQRHPRHEPHMALFLAFLKLFGYAQESLNAITARHLDFYYREVLRLEPKAAQPDQVHVVFELAKNFDRHLLAKGTELAAGKDAAGINLFYATAGELVVNRGRLDPQHGLKTVFVDMEPARGLVRNIHAAPDADSADGLGAPLTDADGKWPAFGGTAMPCATVGFAVASPLFHLAEGTRTIELTFRVRAHGDMLCGADPDVVEEELRRNVRVEASGAKQWVAVEVQEVLVSPKDGTLCYELGLKAEAAAIVGYDDAVLGAGFATRLPVLRFILDNEGLAGQVGRKIGNVARAADYSDEAPAYADGALARYKGRLYRARFAIGRAGYRPADHPELWESLERSYPYKYFQRMEPVGMTLQVGAAGVRALLLENDVGTLNPAKPFLPFGPLPKKKSALLIGSREVFGKSLTSLALRMAWADLPDGAFAQHYQPDVYKKGDGSAIVKDNGHFTVGMSVLADGKWVPGEEEGGAASVALFDPKDPQSAPPVAAPALAPSVAGSLRALDLPPFTRFDLSLRQGYMKLELNQDFLHGMYPGLLATALATPGTVPNAPYTPLIASLSLDYGAGQEIDFSAKGAAADGPLLFHIGPFGQARIEVGNPAPAAPRLVPEFTVDVPRSDGSTQPQTAEGTLYLGLSGLVPADGQNLSLLFQAAEGSEDPAALAQPVTWSWLGADGWHGFGAAEVLADGTGGLLRSGVMQFALPKAMTDAPGLLPGGLHWIKAGVARNTGAIPRLVAVHAQAATATFRDVGNDPNHLAAPLPAGAIAKVRHRDAAIKVVAQPYASFGGRMRESDGAFHLRAAERLRHKRRAISLVDYERLVLEQFPEIHKVKCVNHASRDSELAPGHVRLVVVPSLRNRNAVNPLQPALSLGRLQAIGAWLAGIASDFATLHVTNPQYETIRVRFNVRFHPGRDKGFYTTRLNEDIVRFLSPWLDDEAAELALGGRVHRSAILNFVEERDYVDLVADFRMDHIIGERVLADVEAAQATGASSALVSAPCHEIGHDVVSCEDREAAPEELVAPEPEAGPVPPPAGAKRYLGNTRDRELHDLHRLRPQCQVEAIAIDRRYYFDDPADALALGYDYCAHCFGRDASKR